jgi:hypothetical protein
VFLKVNGQLVSLNLKRHQGTLQSFPVKNLLKPGQMNTLTLFPDLGKNLIRTVRVWVELVPAQSNS